MSINPTEQDIGRPVAFYGYRYAVDGPVYFGRLAGLGGEKNPQEPGEFICPPTGVWVDFKEALFGISWDDAYKFDWAD